MFHTNNLGSLASFGNPGPMLPAQQPVLELREAPALASRWEPLPQSPSRGQMSVLFVTVKGRGEYFL